MGETLHSRCRRICGKSAEDCFVNSKRQLTCLADMLVNKAYGLSAVLEMLKTEGVPETSKPLLEESFQITNDIINWVKYLQISSDMKKEAHTIIERRTNLRYYGISTLSDINLEIGLNGDKSIQAGIINFSAKGIQFICDCPVSDGDTFTASISTEQHNKKVELKGEVKFIADHEGETVVGASITSIDDSSNFDFFQSIMDLAADVTSRINKEEQQ